MNSTQSKVFPLTHTLYNDSPSKPMYLFAKIIAKIHPQKGAATVHIRLAHEPMLRSTSGL